MKAYKGFNKDMTCTPAGKSFQYEEGKTYETEEASLCHTGFHACENPIDCLSYYAPANSVYHEVELEDVSGEREEDTKRCGKKITIGTSLDIKGLVKASIEYIKERCDNNKCGGDGSALNGGNGSVLRGAESSRFKGGMYSVFAAEIWANGELKGVKIAVVDGVKIKTGTWYTLKGRKFVEVGNEND